jgi:hypothetical protein
MLGTSAGILAREMACACLVYFENASRAKMPALPSADAFFENPIAQFSTPATHLQHSHKKTAP